MLAASAVAAQTSIIGSADTRARAEGSLANAANPVFHELANVA